MNADEKVNILMVDDSPSKLLSYEVILSELGENLIKCTSGREALEILYKNDIAVVLTDVSMPEIDGFEMADLIRQHPRFQKTAIIFISAVHLTDSDKIKGYERGAVDYISVPVVPELLRAKVTVFAELHRKTRQLQQLNRTLEDRVEQRTRELRDSENQFRTLANSIPQLAWTADPDGKVLWYNQRWYDYTGATDSSASQWKKVHHPAHLDRVVRNMEICQRERLPWEDTYPILGKDGQYRWFLSRAVPVFDSDGAIVRWFGTSTDVSQQITAEEKINLLNAQLEQRVAELETIMQVLPVGVAVASDPAPQMITANAALCEILGVEATDSLIETVKLPFHFLQNGRPLPAGEFPVLKSAATGKSLETEEIEIRNQQGQPKHLLASARPLFHESGEVRGAVGAFFDVSERKHLEDMLRERADLLELASEAIMVRDFSGILLFWNSGAEALYGWKREEVVGKKIHDFLGTKYPIPRSEIEAILRSQGAWEGELIQHTKDGRELTLACRKARKIGGDAILEINRDITAQLHAEAALRKADRLAAMGRVAGIIAHEINNPLEGIMNVFYLLREHPSLDTEARYYAQIGEQELLRVSHITKQTLSFYRESQTPSIVSVSEVLDSILELQARHFQLNKITVRKEYRSDAFVHGFPSEIRQVFLNLIGNAGQAMPDGGVLRVRIMESRMNGHGDRVCISICDTGHGIAPEAIKRLFEPFFSTKASSGTGLGLWISRGIVQKYEGTISGRTMHLPDGSFTCFRVVLPLARKATPLAGPMKLNGFQPPDTAEQSTESS